MTREAALPQTPSKPQPVPDESSDIPAVRIRYFLVEPDALSAYGHRYGETRTDFQTVLEEMALPIARGELVILRGEVVEVDIPMPLRLRLTDA